jgi:C4-dicarboxylate-specific signal transduction histidine kinase
MLKYLSYFSIIFTVLALVLLGFSLAETKWAVASLVVACSFGIANFIVNYYTKTVDQFFVTQEAFDRLKVDHEKALEKIEAMEGMKVHLSRLSSLGEVAGNIGHEMNNQLSVLEAFGEKLLMVHESKKVFDKDYIFQTGEKIKKHTENLHHLTKGIRNYVRASGEEEKEYVEVQSIVDQALYLAKPKAKKHHVMLKTFLDMKGVQIYCNPLEISQIILNLITNAIDAIAETHDAWIQIHSWIEDENILISVTDSGNGIPKDLAVKIMDPYFTTKEAGKGTGIGLSISKEIAKDHGGKLIYDSNFRHTRFILKLPMQKPEQKSA